MSSSITRRKILGLGVTAAATMVLPRAILGAPSPISVIAPKRTIATPLTSAPARGAALLSRKLKFHNTHTGENLTATYWADGAYIPDSLSEIKKVLRDHRSGEEHDIDTRLLDLLHKLQRKLDTKESFAVISGYRSPTTNGLMHEKSNGVAKHSLHMVGEAIDIRVAGRDLDLLHRTALSLKGGGVGYYPTSDFVHVDCGKVRQWGQGVA